MARDAREPSSYFGNFAIAFDTIDHQYPTLSEDGLTLYGQTFHLEGDQTTKNYDLVKGVRTSRTEPFGALVVLEGPTGGNEYDPFILANGSALYFGAEDEAKERLLYRASISNGQFGAVQLVNAIDVNLLGARQGHPVVTADEHHLYFGSNRAGGEGAADIYVASRTNTAEPYGEATRIPSVSTAADEHPTWISPDHCVMYLQRKAGPDNKWDIFSAEREP